ncbi:MAG: hypothetical protein C0467_16110 [Planctomycetaceae bacterium]|nr:hypothetical protein [Planctomycetaceae bacterium]
MAGKHCAPCGALEGPSGHRRGVRRGGPILSLPSGVSEADFLEIVDHIAKTLRPKFGRVHGSKEDFAQQVVVWSLEALPRYDSSRPLPNYLYRNARNRALNAVRDKVTRFDYPCKECHEGRPCGPNGNFCPKYAAWSKRNQAKEKLSRVLPLQASSDRPTGPSTAEDEVLARDLASKIEAEMPPKLLADYKKMLEGDWRSVSRSRRQRIRRVVAEILGEDGIVPLCGEAVR